MYCRDIGSRGSPLFYSGIRAQGRDNGWLSSSIGFNGRVGGRIGGSRIGWRLRRGRLGHKGRNESRKDQSRYAHKGITHRLGNLQLNEHKGEVEGIQETRKLKNQLADKIIKKAKDQKIQFLKKKAKISFKTDFEGVNSETPTCYRCQGSGHYAFACPSKYYTPMPNSLKEAREYMVKGTDYGLWENIWYVNDTIDQHITGNKSLFKNFKRCFHVSVDEEKR
jgi:hypothetical protein